MINVLIIAILFLLTLIYISFKLKNKKQVVILWLGIFIGLPLLCIIGYQWALWQGEKDVIAANKQCSETTSLDNLSLYFNGFQESDLRDSAFTIHKNSRGVVLDSNQQLIRIDKKGGKNSWTYYHYKLPFATTDILEINLGKRKYILSNFKLTALVYGSMLAAPKILGCRIDSATINGKPIPFYQNMTIRKTDR